MPDKHLLKVEDDAPQDENCGKVDEDDSGFEVDQLGEGGKPEEYFICTISNSSK